jgi:hypothetical protein
MTADRIVRIVRDKIPREEEVQEDPRNPGPTPFLEETGISLTKGKKKKI